LDRAVGEELSADKLLTIALMPTNSRLRNRVTGCLPRDSERKKELQKLKETAKKEELVPVEVHAGGKCKITIFMTKEAAEHERR